MKIAFLLQSFPCLSETFILNQITGLMDLGCDVKIIAFNDPKEAKQHPDVAKYRLLYRTTWLQLPRSKWLIRCKAVGQTLSVFLRHPLLVYRLQKTLLAEGRSYSYPKLFMALAVIRQGADVLQCHYGPVGCQAVFLKDIGLNVKISTVFHGYDLSLYLNEHGPDAYRRLFAKDDIFLPISEFWKKKLIAIGCPEEKIVVCHMGIDTTIFKPDIGKKVSQPLKILTVARLTEKKGHRYALEAMHKIIGMLPRMEYHIAGDGPLGETLKKLTRDLGLQTHVVFHGNIDAQEVLDLYKTADIFLLPSVTSASGDREGIPVSLMEAMACALPVITSQHSGIPELVNNGQTGYAVEEKDVQSIADRILELAGNDELRTKLGRQGRAFVELNFNHRVLMRQLLEIFKGKLEARD
jgi:colanic acid/amylovoran biosynthesis glycosyltransferase